jgi:phage-related protein
MTPHLTLVDVYGTTYDFPPDFWLIGDGWKLTTNIRNTPFAPGGKDLADGDLEPRAITITGTLRADTLAELEVKRSAFQKAMKNGGRLYVSDDVRTRYLTVSGAMVDTEYQGEYRISKKASVSFNAVFPLWQDDTETVVTETCTDPTEFDVDNSESEYYAAPVIKIEANRGADVPTITIINLSDSGMRMEYSDPFFVIGDVVEIDCGEGTVKRNGNDTIAYLAQPRFLRLQDIVNEIRVEGATADVTFTWRKVTI